LEEFGLLKKLPASADLVLLISNAFIFGQDWVMFMAADQGRLSLTSDFSKNVLPLSKGLLIPQAWTLGVELTFYLIAPFVLTKKKLLILLLCASVLLRLYLIKIGIGHQDPWVYRFFPTELALFLSGALAHQILLPFYKRVLKENIHQYSKAMTYLLIFFTLLYAQITLDASIKKYVLFSAYIFLLPFIFLFQDQNKVDKWIGELSYPIYINHMLVMFWVAYAAENLKLPVNNIYYALAVMGGSILLAIFLNKVVQSWFEKIRTKIKAKNSLR
jgi:peptidoglycan/LPS O-acetylase OafA/YrhL